MKEHIITAILYQDMSSKWKDAELNGGVNVHLNVHQKARQFVEVELGDFLLSDGDAILVSFEKEEDGELYHVNPEKMENIAGDSKAFRIQIPTLVHNTPGVWGVQFYLVTDYNAVTGEYASAHPFDVLDFSEHSSFLDDGLTVPTKENLSALYKEIENKVEQETLNSERIAENEKNIQFTSQAVEKNINNIALLADVQYQSGLQYIQPIEEEYGERVTANGESIVDWQGNGSTARLLKVAGDTQATKNLINPALTTGSVTYAMDGNSIVLTNTKGSPSSFYVYSVKKTKGTYTLSVKDIAGESSRRFLSIYKDGVVQQTLTTFPAVVTITLDEDAEISLRGEVDIGEYNTTTISELQLVEGVYTEDTMPEYTPYFDGLKSASFQGITSRNSRGTIRKWLSLPAPIDCGLGTTIDFENQRIINKYSEVTFAGEDSEGWEVSFGWNGMDDDGNVDKGYAYAPITTIRDFIKGSELFSGQWKLASISSMYEDDPELVDLMPPDKGEYYIACDENGNPKTLYLGTGDMLSNWSTMLADWKEYLKKNPITLRCFTTTETVIPFTDEQKAVGNEYTAWTDGTEQVMGNGSAEYGIYPTLTQEYVLVMDIKETAQETVDETITQALQEAY